MERYCLIGSLPWTPTPTILFGNPAAWQPNEYISKYGAKKFNDLCDFLGKMSKLTMQMARKKCFGSDERVEVIHAVAGMLGCAEYGILSTEHWEVGYYDRIDDRYCQYLKRDFASQRIQKRD